MIRRRNRTTRPPRWSPEALSRIPLDHRSPWHLQAMISRITPCSHLLHPSSLFPSSDHGGAREAHSDGADDRGDDCLADGVANIPVARKRRHSSGSGSDGDIDDGCSAKRLFQERCSAPDKSVPVRWVTWPITTSTQEIDHSGSMSRKQPIVAGSSITDHIGHVATRLAADTVSAVAANYMVNTLVKSYSKDLREHLNVDFTKRPASDCDVPLDTSVERLLAIGTCAQLKKSSGKDEFYRFLPGTRFLCRDGAFVQYTKCVINGCLTVAAGPEPPQEHIDRLSMAYKFLLDVNRYCKASLPPLMDALESGLMSLSTCGHAELARLTHRLTMSLLKQHYVQDPEAKAACTDWRALDVLPMSSEVAEVRHPVNGYVRIPGNTMPDYLRVENHYESVDEYVSIYFRLLREDCFGKILHDISCVREGEKIQSGSHVYQRIAVTGIKFLPHPPGAALALKLADGRTATRNKMINGTLLAISLDPIRHCWQFAIVVSPAFNTTSYDVLVTFLSPSGDEVFKAKESMDIVGREMKAVILKSPTHFLSYGPVLRVLQAHELEKDLPFQDVLLGPNRQSPATDGAAADALPSAPCSGHPSAMEDGGGGDGWTTEHGLSLSTAPSFLTPSATLDFSWIFASAERKTPAAALSTRLPSMQPRSAISTAEWDTEIAMEDSVGAVDMPTGSLPPSQSPLCAVTGPAVSLGRGGNSTVTPLLCQGASSELRYPSYSSSSSTVPADSHDTAANADTDTEDRVGTARARFTGPDSHTLPVVPLATTSQHPLGLIQCADGYRDLLSDRRYRCILDDTQQDAILTALTQEVALIQGPPGTGKTFIGCRLVELLLSLQPALPGPILVITYKNRALNDFLAGVASSKAVSGDEVVRVGGMYPEGTQRWQKGDAGIYANRAKGHEVMRPDGFIHLKGHGSYTISKPHLRNMDESMAKTRYAVYHQPRGFTLDTFEKFASAEQRRLALEMSGRKLGRYVWSWAESAEQHMKSAIDQTQTSQPRTSRHGPRPACAVHAGTSQSAYRNTQPSDRRSVSQSRSSSMSLTISRRMHAGRISGHDDEEASSDEERMAQHYHGFRGDIDRKGDERDSDPNMVAMGDVDTDNNGADVIIKNSVCQRYATLQSPEHLEDRNIYTTDNLDKLKPEQRARWICAAVAKERERHWSGLDTVLADHSRECSQKSTEKTYLLGKMLHHRAKVVGLTTSGAAIYHQLVQEIEPSVVLVEEAAEISEPQLLAAVPKSTQQLILIGDQKQLQPHVECYAVEKRGLGVSMFERLIACGHPQSVLHLQNRMRDEFAQLLRLLDIYPRLETNPVTTGGNVPPSCMADSLYFWTHEYPEERTGMSYCNRQECSLVIRLAVWMMFQAVEPKDITILATYKGQVRIIREGLRNLWQEMKLPLPQESQGSSSRIQRLPINVDSVDNFQGDENKIIILSLVRSNSSNSIGYLEKKNRLCVALSRARCGLYLVGDSRVLLASPGGAHWKVIVEHLRASGSFGDQIRLRCPRHADTIVCVSPEEFLALNLLAGVCKLPCSQMMKCGVHRCERSCHDHIRDAEHMSCTGIVEFVRDPCGHADSRSCGKPEGLCLTQCDRRRPDCNHLCRRLCHQDCQGKPCNECTTIKRVKERQREAALLEERQAQRKQLEAEIAAMKAMEKDKLPGSVQVVDPEEDKEAFDKVTELLNHGGSATEVSYDLRRLEKVHPSYDIKLNYLNSKKGLQHPNDSKHLFMEIDLPVCEVKRKATVVDVKTKISSRFCWDPVYRVGKGLHVARTGVRFTPGPVQNLQNPDDESEMIAFVFEVATGHVHRMSMKEQTDKFNNADDLTEKFKKDSIKLESVPSCYESGRRFDRYVCLRRNQATPCYIAYYVKRTVQLIDHIVRLPAKELIVIKRDDEGVRDYLYRHAESQFHRMYLKSHSGTKPNVLAVDCFHNPDLVNAFQRKADEFKTRGMPTNQLLAFHGTKQDISFKIMEEGFKVGGKDTAVAHGAKYGRGVYLAETPNTSHNFAENGQLLLSTFLPGKVEHGDGFKAGSTDESCTCFQTSYHGRNEIAYVVKTSEQVLPLFVVHYEGLK